MKLEISQPIAEQIKIRVGCAIPTVEKRSMQVTGKDIPRGGPRTLTVTSVQVSEALQEPVDAILDTAQRALENCSPALLADIKERGIVLTGGGALLPGLDILMEKMTGIRTIVADDPLKSVVVGCGMAIEDPERWKRIFIG
jgi:rod shape-determining protein MreB and related proteins